jgi:hypothetical protein
VNSQSGKGGVAYLLETEFGIELPKELQREFGPIANDAVDRLGREVSGTELKAMFWKESLLDVLRWAARETGRELVFADPELELAAMRADVSGSLPNVAPIEAATSVLAATRFTYRIEAARIVIER